MIIAKAQKFSQTRTLVRELRLNSLAATVASANTQAATGTYRIRLSDASEWEIAKAVACQLGGTAIPIGLVFRFKWSETIADDPLLSAGARVENSVFERWARSTLNVKPGRAGQYYLQSKTVSLGGLFLEMYQCGGFNAQLRAMFEACSNLRVTNDRQALTTGGAVFGSGDGAANIEARNVVPDLMMRLCSAGTATPVPENGTPYEDGIPFLFTLDGSPSGVDGAGISIDDAFSAASPWQFAIQPIYDEGIRSPGSALTGGTVTITPSLIYRVAKAEKFGAMWCRSTNVITLNGGTTATIPGGSVSQHAFVGWFPDIYGEAGDDVGVVDGTNYPWMEAEAGTGGFIKARIVPPMIPPADLITEGKYLAIGRESGDRFFPLGGNVQGAYGDEPVREWNDHHVLTAERMAFGKARERMELPLFSDVGARAKSTSFVTRGNIVKYGASFAAGSLLSTIAAPRGDSSYPAGIGGFNAFPIAWCDRSVKGFAGVEIRAEGDEAGITVQAVKGFQAPRTPFNSGNAADGKGVTVWKSVGTSYADAGSTPCDTNVTQVPVVPNTAASLSSPALAKGLALTTTFAPKVDVMLSGKKPTVL